MKHPKEHHTHLTVEQLNTYRAGSYPTEMTQMIDRHLKLCITCRDRSQEREILDEESQTFLRRLVVKALDTPIRHFNYRRLAAYVDDKLTEVDREMADAHLADCVLCQSQVSELRAFKTELQESLPTAQSTRLLTLQEKIGLTGAWVSWNAFRGQGFTRASVWSIAAAAVLLALAASLFVVTSMRKPKTNEQQAASVPKQTTPPELRNGAKATVSQPPVVSAPPIQIQPKGRGTRASKPGASPTALTLNDGPGRLNFEVERPLETLEKLDPVTRRQVLTAFNSQRLNKPESLRELEPSTEFRGPDTDTALPEGSTPFKHLSPVNTVLREDQPMFRWMPHPAAVGYKVRIFDDQDRKIAESPMLPLVDSWKSVKLPRGRQGLIYSWKLIAVLKDGQELVARRRTGPPKFFVIGEDNLERLQALERSYPDYHLLLGIAYANAGLTALAKQELAILQKSNPTSDFSARLLQSVRSWSETK